MKKENLEVWILVGGSRRPEYDEREHTVQGAVPEVFRQCFIEAGDDEEFTVHWADTSEGSDIRASLYLDGQLAKQMWKPPGQTRAAMSLQYIRVDRTMHAAMRWSRIPLIPPPRGIPPDNLVPTPGVITLKLERGPIQKTSPDKVHTALLSTVVDTAGTRGLTHYITRGPDIESPRGENTILHRMLETSKTSITTFSFYYRSAEVLQHMGFHVPISSMPSSSVQEDIINTQEATEPAHAPTQVEKSEAFTVRSTPSQKRSRQEDAVASQDEDDEDEPRYFGSRAHMLEAKKQVVRDELSIVTHELKEMAALRDEILAASADQDGHLSGLSPLSSEDEEETAFRAVLDTRLQDFNADHHFLGGHLEKTEEQLADMKTMQAKWGAKDAEESTSRAAKKTKHA